MLAWIANMEFAGGGTPVRASPTTTERVMHQHRANAYGYGYRYLMGVCLWISR